MIVRMFTFHKNMREQEKKAIITEASSPEFMETAETVAFYWGVSLVFCLLFISAKTITGRRNVKAGYDMQVDFSLGALQERFYI